MLALLEHHFTLIVALVSLMLISHMEWWWKWTNRRWTCGFSSSLPDNILSVVRFR